MKFMYIFLISSSFLFAQDFITKLEYAKMLYQNPRGISCSKCHGQKGEQNLIAKYKIYDRKTNSYVERSITAPRINNIDFASFKEAMENSKGVMPTYFLTDVEILSLYEYIQSFNKDGK